MFGTCSVKKMEREREWEGRERYIHVYKSWGVSHNQYSTEEDLQIVSRNRRTRPKLLLKWRRKEINSDTIIQTKNSETLANLLNQDERRLSRFPLLRCWRCWLQELATDRNERNTLTEHYIMILCRVTMVPVTELTEMNSRAKGSSARIVNVVEMTVGGRFSGSLNMCCRWWSIGKRWVSVSITCTHTQTQTEVSFRGWNLCWWKNSVNNTCTLTNITESSFWGWNLGWRAIF